MKKKFEGFIKDKNRYKIEKNKKVARSCWHQINKLLRLINKTDPYKKLTNPILQGQNRSKIPCNIIIRTFSGKGP